MVGSIMRLSENEFQKYQESFEALQESDNQRTNYLMNLPLLSCKDTSLNDIKSLILENLPWIVRINKELCEVIEKSVM